MALGSAAIWTRDAASLAHCAGRTTNERLRCRHWFERARSRNEAVAVATACRHCCAGGYGHNSETLGEAIIGRAPHRDTITRPHSLSHPLASLAGHRSLRRLGWCFCGGAPHRELRRGGPQDGP